MSIANRTIGPEVQRLAKMMFETSQPEQLARPMKLFNTFRQRMRRERLDHDISYVALWGWFVREWDLVSKKLESRPRAACGHRSDRGR